MLVPGSAQIFESPPPPQHCSGGLDDCLVILKFLGRIGQSHPILADSAVRGYGAMGMLWAHRDVFKQSRSCVH